MQIYLSLMWGRTILVSWEMPWERNLGDSSQFSILTKNPPPPPNLNCCEHLQRMIKYSLSGSITNWSCSCTMVLITNYPETSLVHVEYQWCCWSEVPERVHKDNTHNTTACSPCCRLAKIQRYPLLYHRTTEALSSSGRDPTQFILHTSPWRVFFKGVFIFLPIINGTTDHVPLCNLIYNDHYIPWKCWSLQQAQHKRWQIPHLKSPVDWAVSNLIDVRQRSSIVLPPIRSQLQILTFLQL